MSTSRDGGRDRAGQGGPPPLRPFGLVLHHDGRFTHEGQPIRNRRLREHFDRSVEYLPEERKYVVRLRHFRGEVEVEEAGFFVRAVDLDRGEVQLSDGTREPLEVATLTESGIDGALLCRVKRGLVAEGLPARFDHGAQAELLQSIEVAGEGLVLGVGGRRVPVPLS
ncbi:MAG: hypothetical protein H6748_06620 [Spirochaetaceae bacterium]|nr:hypothetical protein [Myxococcales bacterium]MCB9723703.1 hypothetical protein [Spirochaetaceae bacterium]